MGRSNVKPVKKLYAPDPFLGGLSWPAPFIKPRNCMHDIVEHEKVP
jgi:hypothetical protein